MKRNLLSLLLITVLVVCNAQTSDKVVGGDLSLVPAYEAAGDVWMDADGNAINSYYSDGLLTYLHEVAGWNAVRVRLLVDPLQDAYLATCQDLDYVKRLGKRVKDAGMKLLLDIFYSDTWADVSSQWMPANWGFNANTATATIAAKVKSYTKEVLDAMAAYGAAPDFVQLGNEVSYGMLWDTAAGGSKKNAFYTSSTYNNYSAQINRFAQLLKAGAEGVRSSACSDTKIVLQCERTASVDQTLNFFDWVEGQAGFSDYDIIGLSYYPIWHGTMQNFDSLLDNLTNGFPDKQVHVVETGYNCQPAGTPTYDTSDTWPYSPAGQAAFLKDLIAVMKKYENVTGLYYWQPEECGNGADADGNNRVMDIWDMRGFWELTWKSGNHALQSAGALMTLKSFLTDDEQQETDLTSKFSNMDFEECTYNEEGGYVSTCPGWQDNINYGQGWSDGPWPKKANEWHSSMVDGYVLQAWNAAGNTLKGGNILYQTASDMPAGVYTISCVVHCDYDGLLLFANDQTTTVNPTSSWGTAYETTVKLTLTQPGNITIGLKFAGDVKSDSEINLYADNFKVAYTDFPTNIECIKPIMPDATDNAWYDLGGRKLRTKPAISGIYIHAGKKVLIK